MLRTDLVKHQWDLLDNEVESKRLHSQLTGIKVSSASMDCHGKTLGKWLQLYVYDGSLMSGGFFC